MSNSSFNISDALKDWGRKLDKYKGLEPGDKRELIIHVQDKFDDLVNQGMIEREAFELAISEVDNAGSTLNNEYLKSRIKDQNKIFRKINIPGMLIINFKNTVKTILRRKKDFAVNALGLVVAFTSAILIYQYIQFEESHDKGYSNSDRIYRVSANSYNRDDNSLRGKYASTFYAITSEIKSEIPEVEEATRLLRLNGSIKFGEFVFSENDIFYGDAGFFKVFGQRIISGSGNDLDQANTIFLSETMAKKYFGADEAVGKNVQVNLQGGALLNMEVRGVYEDLPPNSHMKIDALLSNKNFEIFIDETNAFGSLRLNDVRWRLGGFFHYVLLRGDAKMTGLQKKLDAFVEKNRGTIDERRGVLNTLTLDHVEQIHLSEAKIGEIKAKGDPNIILFLKVIFIAVLALAWINYVNLTVAKSMVRAKEVGIRKVVGSSRRELIIKFISESLMTNFLSVILTVAFVYLLVPYYEQLLDKEVFSTFSLLSPYWARFILILLVGIILSSVYPSVILAAYTPIDVLKGKIKSSPKGILLKKGLVVFQFSICIVLMAFIYALVNQLYFMQNHDLGFALRNDIVIERPLANDSLTNQKMMSFKNELLNSSDVIAATISNFVPGQEILAKSGTQIVAKSTEQEDVYISRLATDDAFLEFYDLELIAGRTFTGNTGSNHDYVLLNRTAAESFGFENPADALGTQLAFVLSDTVEVIGVVENFAQQGMKMNYLPISIEIADNNQTTYISIATNQNIERVLENLETEFTTLFPSDPFDFFVLNSTYNKLYDSEERYANILMIFTLIAILISALGIVGLASFAIRTRSKEIAVRKVLGASVQQLFVRLTREYVLLILIASSLGIPLAVYTVDSWLASFAFRIPLSPILFILPVIAIVIIVLLLLGKYVVDAAVAQPVKALRDE